MFERAKPFLNNSDRNISDFKVSPKAVDEFFGDWKEHEEELLLYGNTRHEMPSLCETRWLSCVVS